MTDKYIHILRHMSKKDAMNMLANQMRTVISKSKVDKMIIQVKLSIILFMVIKCVEN